MTAIDIVVVGGGVAGAAAALAAAATGARVVLVRRGPGVTAMAAGAWPDAPPQPLLDALATAGHPLVACHGPLPHPDGRLLGTALATPAQAAAALPDTSATPGHATPSGATTLVCGIAGLPSFRPHALAALWADAAGLPPGALLGASIAIPGTPAGGWAPLSLALHIERDPASFGALIGAAAEGAGAARVIVPAVLGVANARRTHEAVQAAAGAVTGEALGVAPSLPGWRLDAALLAALAAAGVEVMTGSVCGHTTSHGSVTSVTVSGDVGRATLDASRFVIASGKYTGGGVRIDERFEDSVLDTPVGVARFGRTFDEVAETQALTDPVRLEPQPVLGAGLATDSAGLALDAKGSAWKNVWVAGSARAGTETAMLSLGAAAQDGWDAGVRAAAGSPTADG